MSDRNLSQRQQQPQNANGSELTKTQRRLRKLLENAEHGTHQSTEHELVTDLILTTPPEQTRNVT